MTRGRLLAVAGIVLVVCCGADFLGRIYVPRDHRVRGAESLSAAKIPAPIPPGRIQGDLVAWLPTLRAITPGGETPDDATLTLSLLGVFEERSNTFAVVHAVPAAGSGGKVQRIAVGDEIYGYKVARIEPRRVVLSGERGDQELVLFRPSASSVRATAPAPGASQAEATGQAPAQSSGQPTTATRLPGATDAPQPAPPRPASTPVAGASPAKAAGAKVVESHEVKQGEKFQLPASMQGMPVVNAPPPPPSKKP